MNLSNTIEHKHPFKHWEFSNCLDNLTLDEIKNVSIPKGIRAYDGTRAADHSGGGVDGKLRVFIDKNNCSNYPELSLLIQI